MKMLSLALPALTRRAGFLRHRPIIKQVKPHPAAGAITPRQVLTQLKADLIGKDSHRGVTLTYTWLANQFGHFSLGFIPALIFSYLFAFYTEYDPPALWASVFISSFWTVFELVNFLGPLLAAQACRRRMPGGQGFPPAWENIAFDTLTDVLYFCLGAFSAALFQQYYFIVMEMALVIAAVLVPASYYWYVTKMYQQRAGFPRQIRLGQWANRIDAEDRAAVQRFVSNDGTGQHLLIFGTKGSGKGELSIAMATERAIRHRSCKYLPAMKLLSLLAEREQGADSAGGGSWQSVDTLVIDDINPGEAVGQEFIRPEDFARLLADRSGGASNREALKGRNVIWVLGSDSADGSAGRQWVDMLHGLGINGGDICCINLSRNVPARSGQPAVDLPSQAQQRA